MKLSEIQIENFRCINNIIWKINPNLNILVGENDAGKTAIIDAIHLALGSVAQEQTAYVAIDDFQRGTSELRVTCKFEELDQDTNRFIEYLTYEGEKEKKPVLYISFESELTGKERWPINTRFISGKPIKVINPKEGGIQYSASGGQIEFEARDYLKATYLKPLRDADRELKSRRGSRLSLLINRLVKNTPKEEKIIESIKKFETELREGFSEYTEASDDPAKFGIILRQLIDMLFDEEKENTTISLSLASEQKLKSLLERLDLGFNDGDILINRGLGYNNLLFIAAELSLFDSGFKLIMIEEPEAHLHPQLQLKLAQHLNNLSDAQILLTTHSPNLASKFDLEYLTIVKKGDVYPLDTTSTQLTGDDRLFLQRFLDVTRANLFFAKGVILVEGDSEALILPTLAKLLKYNFTDKGLSIIRVGSKAAVRYAKVFLRSDGKNLNVPVSILTDKDIVPEAMKLVHSEYTKKDSGEINQINEGQVKTFISDYWTLEYDLALGDGKGNDLACEILQAFYRLQTDTGYLEKGKTLHDKMLTHFSNDRAKVASQIMYIFESDNTTKENFQELARKAKPEMAQTLSMILEETQPANLKKKLPKYIIEAIEHVSLTKI